MAQLRKKIQGQERGVTLGSSAVPSSGQRLLPASHRCCKMGVLTNCALQSIRSAALGHGAEQADLQSLGSGGSTALQLTIFGLSKLFFSCLKSCVSALRVEAEALLSFHDMKAKVI